MNAAEARKKTNSNIPKLVNAQIKVATYWVDSAIKTSVNEGKYEARASLSIPDEIKEQVIKLLVIHYETLGYKVKVYDFFTIKMFQISWKGEEY